MKVYLLYVDYAWESSKLLVGIYSTREKAECEQKFISKRDSSWIEEEEVQ